MLGFKIIATGLAMMVVTLVIHALFMVGGAIRAMAHAGIHPGCKRSDHFRMDDGVNFLFYPAYL